MCGLAQPLLGDSLTNGEVVAGLLEVFPDAQTPTKSVAWYRSDKKMGLRVLNQVEANRRQAAGDWDRLRHIGTLARVRNRW